MPDDRLSLKAGKDLETLTRTGRTIWNDALGKIQVKGNCEDSKTIFYTSLYRTYERMVCLSEDGQYYSAFDNQVHQDSGVPFYTDDWIWDTYRATHPLRILLEAKSCKGASVSSVMRPSNPFAGLSRRGET